MGGSLLLRCSVGSGRRSDRVFDNAAKDEEHFAGYRRTGLAKQFGLPRHGNASHHVRAGTLADLSCSKTCNCDGSAKLVPAAATISMIFSSNSCWTRRKSSYPLTVT